MYKELCFIIIVIFAHWPEASAFQQIPALSGSHHYVLNSLFLKAPKNLRSSPLVIFMHGAPFSAIDAKNFTLESLMPIGSEFTKLGYNVVLFERRGFGKSLEPYAEETGPCSHKDYEKSIAATDEDIAAVVENYKSYPLILVGHSAGGFAAIQYARSHSSVKAVVSFAGLRGSDGQGGVCDIEKLKQTFLKAGQTTTVPELWIFSKNDKVFPYLLGESLWSIFSTHVEHSELWIAPPFGTNGHDLMEPTGASLWRDHVQTFLRRALK